MSELFGTDGIRGIAGLAPLDSSTLNALAVALAELVKEGPSPHRVLIGRDTRLSGSWIEDQMSRCLGLNGVEVQAAPISDLVFDVPALIAYCSTFTELVPGDVIVTGTTGGVGAYRTPPLWMKDGDVVEVEISGIGILRNPVKDEVAKAVGQAA